MSFKGILPSTYALAAGACTKIDSDTFLLVTQIGTQKPPLMINSECHPQGIANKKQMGNLGDSQG